jgi:hypothetical protein
LTMYLAVMAIKLRELRVAALTRAFSLMVPIHPTSAEGLKSGA